MLNSSLTQSYLNSSNTHFENLTITIGGSLVMRNSKLVQSGSNNSIILLGTGQLSLSNSSSLNLGGTGKMSLYNTSAAIFSASIFFDGDIAVKGNATLSANQTSDLAPVNITSTSYSSFVLNSSTLQPSGPRVQLGGNRFLASNAFLSFSNSPGISLTAVTTTISDSQVQTTNVKNIILGNSTFLANNSFLSFSNSTRISLTAVTTTISDSQVQTTNATNIIVGNSTSSISSTQISRSIVKVSGPKSAYLNLYGLSSLSLLNSSVSDVLATSFTANSTIALQGGTVSILNSSILSSARGLYGFSPVTKSNTYVSASSNLNIVNSHLEIGQSDLPGIYTRGLFGLYSQRNITVLGSTLRSVASNTNISLSATVPNSPNSVQYMTLNYTTIETANSLALASLSLASTYALIMDHAKINVVNATPFFINAVRLWAIDSNLTTPLAFGNTSSKTPQILGSGFLYNTTTFGVSYAAGSSGSYAIYGWLLTHVFFQSNSQSSPNATITVLDPKTGSVVYTSPTDVNGLTKVAILIKSQSAAGTFSRFISIGSYTLPSYVVQASSGSLTSPQAPVYVNGSALALGSLSTNYNSRVSLKLGDATELSTVNPTQLGLSNASAIYNLVAVTTLIGPSRISPFFAGNQPLVTIISNAYPIFKGNNLGNNFTKSEIDFQTVGVPGYTFYFTAIAPKNTSINGFQVKVDGLNVATREQTNATDYFVSFSVPSGFHSIQLIYVPQSAPQDINQLPSFYPDRLTIIAVVIIAVVGTAFLIFHARRSEKST